MWHVLKARPLRRPEDLLVTRLGLVVVLLFVVVAILLPAFPEGN